MVIKIALFYRFSLRKKAKFSPIKKCTDLLVKSVQTTPGSPLAYVPYARIKWRNFDVIPNSILAVKPITSSQ